jgi:hypothetical protein
VTADDINALVERLQKYCGTLAPPIARGLTYEAHRALTVLLEENTRLRLEFRTDCEKQAEELFAVQKDAARYRWLRNFDLRCKDGVNTNPPCEHVHASMYAHAVGTIPAVRLVTGDELDRAIDAARSQSEGKPDA